MLEFLDLSPQLETPVNIMFLAITGFIAWKGIRTRNPDGNADYVHLLFGCIAAVFFCLVLFQDVLGVVKF
ncbi:MAG: hypothetical protein CMM52_03025 [Rhodospirillaceae bacterium]|nr:hypothetical protein [Rhodospirillaceae bacterium]|tara:strand:- start:9464 stop:9673 length:210 start_codon:yes stop_codon:yes gene_type:complete